MPVAAHKALVRAAESGARLDTPVWLSTVEQRGGVPRRGHLVMVGGIPNSGKSAFVQALAAATSQPTLYYSADQDPWTSTTRLISCLTGEDTNHVATQMAAKTTDYSGVLARSNIHFAFDSNPTLDDIQLELDAYVETWDEYPEIIVIDTLLNIEGAGEKQDDQYIVNQLHGMARTTKACVFALVHASEAIPKDPHRPAPQKAIINKLAALPDLIYMVAYDPNDEALYIAICKTREGKNDPQSERPVAIKADLGRMQFGVTPTWGYQER